MSKKTVIVNLLIRIVRQNEEILRQLQLIHQNTSVSLPFVQTPFISPPYTVTTTDVEKVVSDKWVSVCPRCGQLMTDDPHVCWTIPTLVVDYFGNPRGQL